MHACQVCARTAFFKALLDKYNMINLPADQVDQIEKLRVALKGGLLKHGVK
jgi:hypothetical protein